MRRSSRNARFFFTADWEAVDMETALLALADSHGYVAFARDGVAGIVESPLFPNDADHPSHLLVRFQADDGERLIALPLALAREVDLRKRHLMLGVSRRELAEIPQQHPPSRRGCARDEAFGLVGAPENPFAVMSGFG